jgi:hypothetical protein
MRSSRSFASNTAATCTAVDDAGDADVPISTAARIGAREVPSAALVAPLESAAWGPVAGRARPNHSVEWSRT